MKKILGLDLGTTSIGWAYVKEAETEEEKSAIVKVGVRVKPLAKGEKDNIEKGKAVTTNADRRLKRSMRRNLQRYKLRRNHLLSALKDAGWIREDALLSENGPGTTFETLRLRAKAATECISLEELARVLLMINKKRGYKSNRKIQEAEEGCVVDGMEVAKTLYEKGITPGQYVDALLEKNNKAVIPDFYRSDLLAEFDKIWSVQQKFYPEILTDTLKQELSGKNEAQTWKICEKAFPIQGMKRSFQGRDQLRENYAWRAKAAVAQIGLEELAVVFQKINVQTKKAGGYLGDISDRSKDLFFKGQTIGQYLWEQVQNDCHFSQKNKVFFRRDYMDEFDRIWETQCAFHPELTPALKKRLRDETLFFQRRLKSQKGLVAFCEFEGREMEVEEEGRKKKIRIGPKACPKSAPLFQEFKIWQIINNLKVDGEALTKEERIRLFDRAKTCDKLGTAEILKCLGRKKNTPLNYKEIEGDKTTSCLLAACARIIESSGREAPDFKKMPYTEARSVIDDVFQDLGANSDFLCFDAEAEGKSFEMQPAFRLWHLLYSFEGDASSGGDEKLIEKIQQLTGLDRPYAAILSRVTFPLDYGSLSAKAMKKILPHLKEGKEYSRACADAGYRHSRDSLTQEERASRVLKDRLELLPKNSLRNPVVEKILNQMVHVVNAVIDEYGKPDEIRIELARELKKSAREREEMFKANSEADKEHQKIRKILQEEFRKDHPGKNDIIRYKLYKELEQNGYKTLYSNTYIPREKLFGKDFDIEHIIPQSRLFDDSFSNKTLEARDVNIRKRDMTAFDYVKTQYGEEGLEDYRQRIDALFDKKVISKTKRNKLLMSEEQIPSDFVERDLRDTQYIARKAKTMLEEVVRNVVSTSGSVTKRLREDWQLVDLMKELNWDKYKKIGRIETYEDSDGRKIGRIVDWNKRNDHRHHAMDALTIAFTKPSYIQYLNHLNARLPEGAGINEVSKRIRRFHPPMPLDEFRAEARRQLEGTLVSVKAKNKVVTRNVNRSKTGSGEHRKIQLTPRGSLHMETVYGKRIRLSVKEEKVGGGFDRRKIADVAKPLFREALEKRLECFGGDPKKAFTGKNSLAKSPIYLDASHTKTVPEKVGVLHREETYTIRKEIGPDLNVEKVVDAGIRRILQRRLDDFDGDPQKAFVNLDENPIWLDWEKGIRIRRVAISARVNDVASLHVKRDKNGKVLLDASGWEIPADYVSKGNNHHVAIYRDADGKLQERTVSFLEAATLASEENLPVVDKFYKKDEGWVFLFSMKKNEYFVFPDAETGFDPKEIDLLNPENNALISPHLFRVQNLAKKDYVFQHHLETTVNDANVLREITWKRITNLSLLEGVVKVRIDPIGRIVQVGEY